MHYDINSNDYKWDDCVTQEDNVSGYCIRTAGKISTNICENLE